MTDHRAYFDTSGFVKLILPQESGASVAQSIFGSDVILATSMLTYVETHSALARRFRHQELDEAEWVTALDRVDLIWRSFEVESVADRHIQAATDLLVRFSLSGADAIHLATAVDLGEPLTFITWDRRQAEAGQALGFDIFPDLD